MCINGFCTASASAPTGDCLFGDDQLITSAYYGSLFQAALNFVFPTAQMTCQQILDYAYNTLNISANVYCENSNFLSACCTTCKSN